MSSLSRATSRDEGGVLPQPPKDNTVKLANLWERMAGKDAQHVARESDSPSPNTITVVAAETAPAVERVPSLGNAGRAPSLGNAVRAPSLGSTGRAPSLVVAGRAPSLGTAGRATSVGASGRMPPLPTRSGTRELIDALERKCSEDADANPAKEKDGADDDRDNSGNVAQLVRRLSSAEVDARAEQAVDAAALADMHELKQLVERMTRRVTDLEHKIEEMQAAMPTPQRDDHDAGGSDCDG